ncbi:MAG TPA: sulfate adenylyltransferase subunit CysN [Acetobacteraceae bacterium]|nr:sulfate adenylyltransferase subunit CysN [Acetobacteraceae bacterium]
MDGNALTDRQQPAAQTDGAAALAAYLETQRRIGTLRFLTCGSVDDGKSTLIGRLLYDTKLIFEDQLASLERDSRKHGTTGDDIDFALLVDGLEAEREQGITIDVAYRFFTTDRRRFIVADTPGHEQYTRNMATGASNAELAVVLVDARNGVLTQTRRHSFIASLMGIRHVVLAVNKIDLVGFDQARFEAIRAEYEHAVAEFGFQSLVAIPLSARYGDNVLTRSDRTPWYDGPSLLEHLETVDIGDDLALAPFRMPVQWVNRPDLDFRGFSGTIAAGTVKPGDVVAVASSGRTTTVARIVTMDGDLDEASAGDAVTLALADEIDISRGDVLAAGEAPVAMADQFQAHVVWLNESPMLQGRTYLFKLGTRTAPGSITRIRHRIDINTHEKLSATDLRVNDVAVVNLGLTLPVAFEPYAESRDLGGFIIIDRVSNATVGVGMIDYALRRATNLTWQDLDVDRAARARLKDQQPAVIWFTGLSGSGKSTIANLVERKLHAQGQHTYVLDGDNIRHGLNRDLGFTEADRVENIRRVSEAAALFVDAGLIVLVSFISPYRAERDAARERIGDGEFLEVFVDTPIEECRRRDPKGLYEKAYSGLIRNFTGVDAPYEAPLTPEIHLRTVEAVPEVLADRVIEALRGRNIIR